jgi:hypothetical protein
VLSRPAIPHFPLGSFVLGTLFIEFTPAPLQDFTRRGGRISTPPQTAVYDPKVLDAVNVTDLLKQLPLGAYCTVTASLLAARASPFPHAPAS